MQHSNMGGAAELVEADPAVVADLTRKLVDPATTLPEKYRVLFSLRNVKGQAAQDALVQGSYHSLCALAADAACPPPHISSPSTQCHTLNGA